MIMTLLLHGATLCDELNDTQRFLHGFGNSKTVPQTRICHRIVFQLFWKCVCVIEGTSPGLICTCICKHASKRMSSNHAVAGFHSKKLRNQIAIHKQWFKKQSKQSKQNVKWKEKGAKLMPARGLQTVFLCKLGK